MSDVKKVVRGGIKAATLQDPVENLRSATGLKAAGKGIEAPVKTGASAATRATAKQTLLQQQKEDARVAESEDEIARRRGLAGSKSGRQSLIKSSPSALSNNLGGT